MAQTNIAVVVPTDGSAAVLTSGTQLNLAETAADVSNGNSVKLSGHEVVLAHNTDTSDHHITIFSVPDGSGRSADITSYVVPAGKIACISFFGALGMMGWKQTDGTVHVTADDATIKITAIEVQF